MTLLGLGRACTLLEASRGSFYRTRGPAPEGPGRREVVPLGEEAELMILELPSCGCRPVTAQLQRISRRLNRERVLRAQSRPCNARPLFRGSYAVVSTQARARPTHQGGRCLLRPLAASGIAP